MHKLKFMCRYLNMFRSVYELLFNKIISLRNLLRINTIVILSVFLLSTVLVFWRTYNVLFVAHNKEINLLLDEELNLLNNRINSYKINLESLKIIVNQSLKEGKKVNEKQMADIMTIMAVSQPHIYNSYFALDPYYSSKFFNKKSYVFVVHKNIRLLDSEGFSRPENVVEEHFTNVDYANDPKEIWYHTAKNGRSVQMTDPYYDASYMQVTMISLVMAIQGPDGEFAGVVGLDIPMSVLLSENYKRSIDRGYRVLMVDKQGRSLESLLHEKYNFPNPEVSPEFKMDAKGTTFSLDNQFSIKSASGETFDAISKPILDNKYRLIVMRDRGRIIEPFQVLLKGMLSALIAVLILQIYLSRLISLKIIKNVAKLFENFRANSVQAMTDKDNFKPIHLDELKIQELDEVRIFWIGFLEKFHLALAESRNEKEKADKAAEFQSSFLANMSHEIRTPMNAIVGMADVLAETPLSIEQQRYLHIFRRSADNLLNLLNDILDLAKIEAGSMVIENVKTDLNKIKEDTLMVFSHRAEMKGIYLGFKASTEALGYVMIDPLRLRQIIYNLVGNAIKFTEKGRVDVSFSLSKATNTLCIKVSDTGIGIAESKLKDVFLKFTQADVSTTRKFGGTGLGLSIVHSLVNLMKGEVKVESQEQVGSLFTVHLPFEPVPAELMSTENKIIEPVTLGHHNKNKISVLVVDDVRDNRVVVQLYLKSFGYDCELAVNGQDAVEKYSKQHFDVVLMDIQMPVKDGVEAMKEIRELQIRRGLRSSIIALTAFASLSDNEKYMKIGFDNYLTKPLTKKVFATAMRPYLLS